MSYSAAPYYNNNEDIDYPSLMEPVALHLLGEPNRKLSSSKELRWGNHGSMSVNLEKGAFCDHENDKKGGVLDLIIYMTAGCNSRGDAVQWLRDNGFLEPQRPQRRAPRSSSRSASAPSLKTVAATYDYV